MQTQTADVIPDHRMLDSVLVPWSGTVWTTLVPLCRTVIGCLMDDEAVNGEAQISGQRALFKEMLMIAVMSRGIKELASCCAVNLSSAIDRDLRLPQNNGRAITTKSSGTWPRAATEGFKKIGRWHNIAASENYACDDRQTVPNPPWASSSAHQMDLQVSGKRSNNNALMRPCLKGYDAAWLLADNVAMDCYQCGERLIGQTAKCGKMGWTCWQEMADGTFIGIWGNKQTEPAVSREKLHLEEILDYVG